MGKNNGIFKDKFSTIADKTGAVDGSRSPKEGKRRWSWFGFTGMVGWTVAMPIVLFTMAGVWLDKNHPSHISWTITLLFGGVVLGCYLAWKWISGTSKKE